VRCAAARFLATSYSSRRSSGSRSPGEANAKRAFEGSLSRLGLDHVDLYLIHQPLGDYYSFWRAMEQLHAEGRIRAIGVSNFYPDRLVDLIEHNEVTPAVNQIETHPFFQRRADQDLMRTHGDVFDFTLTDDEMGQIATMDTGASLFFDHRDPAMVSWLNSRRDA